MSAGAGRNADQARRALLDRLVGKALVDHVMQGNAAPAFHGRIHFLARTERGDDNRDLVFFTKRDVFFEPVVGAVDNLVHRERRRRCIRIGAVIAFQLGRNLVQPLIQLTDRPGIE